MTEEELKILKEKAEKADELATQLKATEDAKKVDAGKLELAENKIKELEADLEKSKSLLINTAKDAKDLKPAMEDDLTKDVKAVIEENKRVQKLNLDNKKNEIKKKFEGIEIDDVEDIVILDKIEKALTVTETRVRGTKLTQEEVSKFLKDNPTVQSIILSNATAQLHTIEEETIKEKKDKLFSFFKK